MPSAWEAGAAEGLPQLVVDRQRPIYPPHLGCQLRRVMSISTVLTSYERATAGDDGPLITLLRLTLAMR